MLEVAHDDRQKDFRTIDEILDDELKKMEKLSREGTSLTGTPSGFRDLDEITGGFQPGNLIVIAARPSMGKCKNGSTLVYDSCTGERRRLDELVACTSLAKRSGWRRSAPTCACDTHAFRRRSATACGHCFASRRASAAGPS